MRRVLKWVGIVLGGLMGLVLLIIVAAAAFVYFSTEARMNKTYNIQPETVGIPTDAATIQRGRHLVEAVAKCVGCHGENLAGTVMIEDPALGRLVSGNLTSGRGGIGGAYSDTDFVRSIRHGVGPDRKPLLFMPAQEFYHFSDGDLAAIIAYVKSVPPVDSDLPSSSIGPLGRVLFLQVGA